MIIYVIDSVVIIITESNDKLLTTMPNPRQKVSLFHLTYVGHYMLELPYEVEFLGYCYETAAQDHTHVVLQVKNPISKNTLIRDLTTNLEIPCELDVQTGHRSIGSMLGYHIGLGDKPRCTGYVQLFPAIDIDEYIRRKVAHKATNLNQIALQNQVLLNTPLYNLVTDGIIRLKDLDAIRRARRIFDNERPDPRASLPFFLPNTWGKIIPINPLVKRRHIWIYSESYNRGKSTHRRMWMEAYRILHNPFIEGWWILPHRQTEAIIFDPYSPDNALSPIRLEELCEGKGFRMNEKSGLFTNLDRDLIVIFLSNYSIERVYPMHKGLLYERFIEICVD